MKQLLCIAALALSAFGCASDEPMSAATKSILEQSAAEAAARAASAPGVQR